MCGGLMHGTAIWMFRTRFCSSFDMNVLQQLNTVVMF